MQVERDLKNQAEPFITFSSLTEAAAKLRMLHFKNAVLHKQYYEELGFVIHDVSGSIKCVSNTIQNDLLGSISNVPLFYRLPFCISILFVPRSI